MAKNTEVIEGWTGPGRSDGQIASLLTLEDGLHKDMSKGGMNEWWYFDAHLENGYTVVVFFYASNPNPGRRGKPGVEIVLLRPDGIRNQKLFTYGKRDFHALKDKPEVTIGKNTLRIREEEGKLPIYEIIINEDSIGCNLIYTPQVNGWKPGSGLSQFGDLGFFAWIIPFARASVKGTIIDEGKTMEVSGIGYHDHNWLNFPFQSIINYWMWGRIYSKHYTVSYAFIQCNDKVNNHQVKVLMLAEGQEVVLSTGEFDFTQEKFSFNQESNHWFPEKVTIKIPGKLSVLLKMNKIFEAQDMLKNFNPILRLLAKYLLKIRPGYFRLNSDFELEVVKNGNVTKESGTTLHEIVLFKPAGREVE